MTSGLKIAISNQPDQANSLLAQQFNRASCPSLKQLVQSLNFEHGKIKVKLCRSLDRAATKTVLRKIANTLKDFLFSSPIESCTDAEVNNYIESKKTFEVHVKKAISQIISSTIKFRYFLITDTDNNTKNLVVSVGVSSCTENHKKIKKVLSKLEAQFKITINLNDNLNNIQTISNAKLERLVIKRPSSTTLFIDDQTMKPILTIDNPETYKMEDGFFVRKLSNQKYYCSVHVPARFDDRRTQPLNPMKKVTSLAVEYFYDSNSDIIEDPNVNLVNIQSYARLDYNSVDSNWGKLSSLAELKDNPKKAELIRNLVDALEVTRHWLRNSKNTGLHPLHDASIAHIIIQHLIEMSQTAFAQFMSKSNLPFIAYGKIPRMPDGSARRTYLNISKENLPSSWLPKIINETKELIYQSTNGYFVNIGNSNQLLRAPFKKELAGLSNQAQALCAIHPELTTARKLNSLQDICKKLNRSYLD